MGYQMFGAACFRHGKRMGRQSVGWFLQWIWLHPYFRHHHYMSSAWPRFIERFGRDFIPEFPYSSAMKSFLRKYATPEQLAILSEHGDAEKYLTDDWREASLIMPITSIDLEKFVPNELRNLV